MSMQLRLVSGRLGSLAFARWAGWSAGHVKC